MSGMTRRVVLAACVLLVACVTSERSQAASWEPVALSDSLGAEIDATERDAYHLFPDLHGFQSARFSSEGSAFRVEYSLHGAAGLRTKTARVSPEAWELTRLHVGMVERSRAQAATTPGLADAESQYRLALKFASRARYDVSKPLFEDLVAQYRESPSGVEASSVLSSIDRLATSRRGLFLPGAMYDRGGRTGLLVFAGYYGIWTGLAIPIYLESDSPQAYAAGLLVAPVASLWIANQFSENSEMGVGRALMISLGGNLGTWQGVGWSAVSDARGKDAVGIGLLCGWAGIAGAAALTQGNTVTEGHGALTNSSLVWGGWFGLVAGKVANAEGDNLLSASLVGSDALIIGAAIAARNVPMSKSRVRLITLMGVVGTAFGFGIDLLAEVDSGEAAFAIAGAGSIAGLALGARLTGNYDQGKVLSDVGRSAGEHRVALAPHVTVERGAPGSKRLVPGLGLRVTF